MPKYVPTMTGDCPLPHPSHAPSPNRSRPIHRSQTIPTSPQPRPPSLPFCGGCGKKMTRAPRHARHPVTVPRRVIFIFSDSFFTRHRAEGQTKTRVPNLTPESFSEMSGLCALLAYHSLLQHGCIPRPIPPVIRRCRQCGLGRSR